MCSVVSGVRPVTVVFLLYVVCVCVFVRALRKGARVYMRVGCLRAVVSGVFSVRKVCYLPLFLVVCFHVVLYVFCV